jgi:hypothetical protein
MNWKGYGLAASAALALSSAAFAQPASFTDLGTLSTGTITANATMGGSPATNVAWYKFVIPTGVTATAGWLDLTANAGTPGFSNSDSMMGLYSNTGALITSDDDDGPGNYSEISKGRTTPARTTIAGAAGGNGRDGVLAAGTYWMSLSPYQSTFAANWTVTNTTNTTTTGNGTIRIDYSDGLAPTAPTGAFSATPASGASGVSTLLKVTVIPGANPVSTGTTVTANLSTIGGSATQAFYDDGTNGDVTPGDNIFSFQTTATAACPGTVALPFTVADAQSRSSAGSGSFTFNNMFTCSAVVDLGTMTMPQFISSPTQTLAPASVVWYKVTIPDVSPGSGNWLDIVGSGTISGGTFTNDTYMAVFNSAGTLMAYDDDDGPDAGSALSFGATTPTRPDGNGVVHNGRDGSLAAGTYYVAIGGYACAFSSTFNATSTSNHTSGSVSITLDLNQPASPTLACAGGAGLAGSSVLLTGTAVPGQNPTSLTLAVTGDLSSIGGSATQTFYDDGTNGDVTAGDHVFSYAYTIPGATAGGNYSVPMIVTDDLARTATCTASIAVDETGSLPATAVTTGANPITGSLSAGDVDMYRIHICDPANFSAAVSAATISDTQLFLFRLDGTGVAMNDDYPAGSYNTSTLTGAVVQSITAGDYYLAISSYDNDPVDSAAAALWLDTPYNTVRAPDGAGAANALASWDGAGTNTGTYTINLTGVSTSECLPPCGSADFNCDGDVGTDADIEAFFACLAGNCPSAPCTSSADFNGDGDIGTDADIEAFFRVLGGGHC